MGAAQFVAHLFFAMFSCLGLLGVPMPLPLPPLPEDPALLRAAPADSLLFVQWFGAGEPVPGSPNRAERLAAEPEVRAMVQQLAVATRSALAHDPQGTRQAPGVLAMLAQVEPALQRPGCLFVTGLEPFAGGLVVNVGEGVHAFEAAFERALAQWVPGLDLGATRTIGGVEFGGGGQPLEWAAVDDYFVVVCGEGAAAHVAAALRGEDQGLAGRSGMPALRAECRVERPVLRTFADLRRLAEGTHGGRLWQPLGLQAVDAALAESGLEGDGFVSRLQLVTAQPEGLLGRLDGRPLSQDDLELIPEDATVALGLRTGEGGFEGALLDTLHAFWGLPMESDWQQFLAMGKQQTGVDFVADLIAHADDCVVAWSAPSEGGLWFTSATAAAPLRDGKAFGEHLTRMWEKLTDVAPNKADPERARLSHRAYLERFEHGDTRVWWVDLIDRDFPFAFAWTSTDRHLLIGLQPQPVRSAIERSRRPNFDHALVRRPQVSRRGPATAMLYLDCKRLLEQAYGGLLVLFQLGSLEWQRDGFDFDLADLPRLQTLTSHLGPELAVLTRNDHGFQLTRRGSLPVFDPLLVTAGMACLLR